MKMLFGGSRVFLVSIVGYFEWKEINTVKYATENKMRQILKFLLTVTVASLVAVALIFSSNYTIANKKITMIHRLVTPCKK